MLRAILLPLLALALVTGSETASPMPADTSLVAWFPDTRAAIEAFDQVGPAAAHEPVVKGQLSHQWSRRLGLGDRRFITKGPALLVVARGGTGSDRLLLLPMAAEATPAVAHRRLGERLVAVNLGGDGLRLALSAAEQYADLAARPPVDAVARLLCSPRDLVTAEPTMLEGLLAAVFVTDHPQRSQRQRAALSRLGRLAGRVLTTALAEIELIQIDVTLAIPSLALDTRLAFAEDSPLAAALAECKPRAVEPALAQLPAGQRWATLALGDGTPLLAWLRTTLANLAHSDRDYGLVDADLLAALDLLVGHWRGDATLAIGPGPDLAWHLAGTAGLVEPTTVGTALTTPLGLAGALPAALASCGLVTSFVPAAADRPGRLDTVYDPAAAPLAASWAPGPTDLAVVGEWLVAAQGTAAGSTPAMFESRVEFGADQALYLDLRPLPFLRRAARRMVAGRERRTVIEKTLLHLPDDRQFLVALEAGDRPRLRAILPVTPYGVFQQTAFAVMTNRIDDD